MKLQPKETASPAGQGRAGTAAAAHGLAAGSFCSPTRGARQCQRLQLCEGSRDSLISSRHLNQSLSLYPKCFLCSPGYAALGCGKHLRWQWLLEQKEECAGDQVLFYESLFTTTCLRLEEVASGPMRKKDVSNLYKIQPFPATASCPLGMALRWE